MILTYKFDYESDEYKIWGPTITIPCTRIIDGEPRRSFFKKEVDWDSVDVKSYWAWKNEHGIWNLYRVYKNPANRRLAWSTAVDVSLEHVIKMIQEKIIDVHSCDAVDRYDNYLRGPKIYVTNNWSIEYDGRSVIELLAAKPKMSFAEVKRIIENEGGYIDEQTFIHRGVAENKIVNLK